MISDKEDTDTLEVFFKVVKASCPEAQLNTLITDDGTIITARETRILSIAIGITKETISKHSHILDLAGVLACSKVYEGVRHILCRWHVDR